MISSLTTHAGGRPVGFMFAFAVLSWLGEFVHNLYELPNLTPLSPENSIPAVISLALFAMWWLMPSNRVASVLFLAWGLLHLIGGGILSVMPFGFLPFYPRQTLDHYAAHVEYGLAQIPLILLAIKQLRAR